MSVYQPRTFHDPMGFGAALAEGIGSDRLNLIELTVDLCDPPA